MGKTRILTNSMAGCFLSCRQKFDYRFNRQIVPVDDNVTALSFGSAVHAALERWFRYGIKDDAILVAESFPGLELENQLKASVLVEKYIEHWGDKEPFEVVDVEKEFNVPLRNPANGHKSRTWTLCGKADGIVELNGEPYILEHKTTSCLDDAYIQRIGIDRQIAVYANAIGYVYGNPAVGAIYDILQKPTIRMKKGETEEEFQARRAALIAKSKTGTSSAKRQEPESEAAFKQRLRETIDGSYFRREIVKFTPEDIKMHMSELWAISKEMRTGVLYRNTGECNALGRKCPYLELCLARGDMAKCEGIYTTKRANEELSADINEGDDQ